MVELCDRCGVAPACEWVTWSVKSLPVIVTGYYCIYCVVLIQEREVEGLLSIQARERTW
jgi:hypothetical protein